MYVLLSECECVCVGASDVYACMHACMCMHVCMYVCMYVIMYYIDNNII